MKRILILTFLALLPLSLGACGSTGGIQESVSTGGYQDAAARSDAQSPPKDETLSQQERNLVDELVEASPVTANWSMAYGTDSGAGKIYFSKKEGRLYADGDIPVTVTGQTISFRPSTGTISLTKQGNRLNGTQIYNGHELNLEAQLR